LVQIAVTYTLLLNIAVDVGSFYSHCVQDWDALVDGYVQRAIEVEDELLENPCIDARPEVPGAVAYLREREGRSTSSRKPHLGHYEVIPVPRRFYVQLRECDLVVFVVPPDIAWEVSRVLKITSQAGATISLSHGEFCEYRIHMEWFHGKLFFMRGWDAMVKRLTRWKDDFLVFELDVNCFQFTLSRATSSVQPVMKCDTSQTYL
jgi:hypothetical protein